MERHQTAEERLYDSIRMRIKAEHAGKGGGDMPDSEARAIAQTYKEFGKGTMAIRVKGIMNSLGTVAEKAVKKGFIPITPDIKGGNHDIENHDIDIFLMKQALLIMLIHYRQSFIRLMKQWGIDPQPYIDTYHQSQQ